MKSPTTTTVPGLGSSRSFFVAGALYRSPISIQLGPPMYCLTICFVMQILIGPGAYCSSHLPTGMPVLQAHSIGSFQSVQLAGCYWEQGAIVICQHQPRQKAIGPCE